MIPRKIVFINQATGYLTIDVINEFAEVFESVALITGSIRVQDTEPDKRITISRITKYNRGNVFKKAASWLIGTVQLALLLRLKYRAFEVVYFTIPPTACLLAPCFKNRYSLIVYDLYPEALSTYGFRPQGFVYKWWSKRNRKIFGKAYRVFTLGESMKEAIEAYAPGCKVHVIPNWTAFSGAIPVLKNDNWLIRTHGLEGKFIVQYSGNIGFTHHVEEIVNLAATLRAEDDIFFLIIGRGKRAEDISDLIKEKGLANCLVLPFRPDDELYDSLCAADIAVVTLNERGPDISVPSKAFNILAAGTPVMVIAHEGSGIAKLVEKHSNGKTFTPEDLSGMRDFIIMLKNNTSLRKELSAKSLEAAGEYTSANARKYLDIYLSEQNR